MEGDVEPGVDHRGARPEVDQLWHHDVAEHRLPLGDVVVADGRTVDRRAIAVAAARLSETGRGAVATAGVARLEGVVALTADLAELDSAEETVSTHADQRFPRVRWEG